MKELENRIDKLIQNFSEPQLTTSQNLSLNDISLELSTEEAIKSIKNDPYWPKWDSPWWKVILLYDAGFKELIPREFLQELMDVIDKHYLQNFPLVEKEIPENCDPYRHILCFCALGSMYKVFEGCGVNVKERLPWWYEWLVKYQLPDGGYNCEEGAYTGSKKSSFQSTLPVLEAMLIVYRKTNDPLIEELLDKGAEYLVNHEVYKSSQGKIIEPEWIHLTFPNYYDYDILRGFSFLVEWAHLSNYSIPLEIITDCLNLIEASLDSEGCIILGINKLHREGSLFLEKDEWVWYNKSIPFAALEMFSKEGEVSVPLTHKWRRVLRLLFSENKQL